MTDIQLFQFNSTEVRIVLINYEPWFVAHDIKSILEIDSSSLRRLKVYEKGVYNIHTLGGNQAMTIISESGLYRLILTSRKPQAEPFQDWIVQEVLPSIRKTGSYSTQPSPQLPQDYLSALKALVVSEEEKLVLQTKNQILEAQTEFYAGKLGEAEDVLVAYRALVSDEACLSFKQIADALSIKGLGRNRLLKYARSKKFLVQSGTVPYHRVIEAGWAVVVTSSWEGIDGTIRTTQSTRLTFDGLTWLVKNLIKDGYAVKTTPEQIWDKYNAVIDLADSSSELELQTDLSTH